jgi:hypothetical protein
MSLVWWVIGLALAGDLVVAFVIPRKVHRLCAGVGCLFCHGTGKVFRFGARLVRPDLRRK